MGACLWFTSTELVNASITDTKHASKLAIYQYCYSSNRDACRDSLVMACSDHTHIDASYVGRAGSIADRHALVLPVVRYLAGGTGRSLLTSYAGTYCTSAGSICTRILGLGTFYLLF